MTEAEAQAIYRRGCAATVAALLALAAQVARLRAENAELRGRLQASTTAAPTTPSGAVPPYQKPNAPRGTRRARPGRTKGHPGASRPAATTIDREVIHPPLTRCPQCHEPVTADPSEVRTRLIEGVVRLAAETVRHLIPRQYCPRCQPWVSPPGEIGRPACANSATTVATLMPQR